MATAEEDCILETPRKRKIAPKEPRNPRPASFATRRESRGNGFSWTTQQPMAPPIRQAKLLHKKLSLKPMAGSVRDSACTRTFIGSMLRDASAARWYAEMFRKGGMQNIANVYNETAKNIPIVTVSSGNMNASLAGSVLLVELTSCP
mmetsp:Transcript_1896/g.4265  ORF Transcript_1896/g.4265 Transcript_1896/m.4265 type:complete len:147 (+) Transcript_1896:1276-1716(+)